MGHYVLKKTIKRHYDSINTLAFSHNGSLFASGSDDSLIIVFQGNGSGREIHRFQAKAPVTTLMWRSRFGFTIVAGDTSGDVHTICLGNSTNQNPFHHTINNVPGPVHCTAQSGIWLAIGSGKIVQLIKQGTIATWERATLLPDPPKFLELEGELPEPMARSLHFLGTNDGVLLVTYLDHGVIAWNLKTLEVDWRIRPRSCKIGCSVVSPNRKTLAITNLYDGIDWYSLNSNYFMDTPFRHTTTHPTPENVMLPVTFIHGGSAVLSGTSYGCARITNAENWSLAEKLPHETEDIVQAVAYSSGWDKRQIVTGMAERGSELTIQYWIQERSLKKHKEPGQQTAKKQVRAYLELALQKPVMAMVFVVLGLATIQVVAVWHLKTGSIDWRQWFCDAKRGSPESQPEHWWYWASKSMGGIEVDDSLPVSAVPQPDQDLGFALEQHGTNALKMTTLGGARDGGGREIQGEVLCFANPTSQAKHLH